MSSKIDLKSVLLGLALGGLLMATFGAAPNPGGDVGRFTIETSEGHAFVLDTVTGSVWENFTPPNLGGIQQRFSEQKLPRPGTR